MEAGPGVGVADRVGVGGTNDAPNLLSARRDGRAMKGENAVQA